MFEHFLFCSAQGQSMTVVVVSCQGTLILGQAIWKLGLGMPLWWVASSYRNGQGVWAFQVVE